MTLAPTGVPCGGGRAAPQRADGVPATLASAVGVAAVLASADDAAATGGAA